jgi:arylsulfatase A-like enzyme
MQSPGPQSSSSTTPHTLPRQNLGWRLFWLTVFASYFFVLMEWLFFATKPSFMDLMTAWQKIDLLLASGLLISVLALLPVLVVWGLSSLPGLKKISRIFYYAGAAVPASLLSITTLLLVDNFTYTLFRFGIVSTPGPTRIVYTLLFLALLVAWYRQVAKWLFAIPSPQPTKRLDRLAVVGLILIILPALLTLPKLLSLAGPDSGAASEAQISRPNILLIGTDGLNASNTSLYGYSRDTTPNLRHLADESLLADNAFPNSAGTSGSIISILNSKNPTQTRVMYPPDILRDSDAYQHLPGILHKLGYRTNEISVSHYIDAYTLNLRDGFDIVNDRSMDQAGFQLISQYPAFQDLSYFLSVLLERTSDRLMHIFFIQQMTNPYQEVTATQVPSKDQSRVRRLINYLTESDQPAFIHIHLMGTHGNQFSPSKYVFSAGQRQDLPWMTDFYDDTILEFDEYVGEILSELSKLGISDNTIIVIYTDHAQRYLTDQKIPLLFRFPKGEFAGRIQNNVQNLDIAPTILDYMGVPVPDWMEGQSLLAGEPDPQRIIFSSGIARASPNESGYWNLESEYITPPFYQFAYIQAIICQNWYRVDLIDLLWTQGEISGHSAPCDPQGLPQPQDVQARIVERMERDGFDTSTLRDFFTRPSSD